MQSPDFERFKAIMAGMGKLYEREIDGVLMDAYWLALGNWSLTDFSQAAAHLMATNKYMPRPSDFNELRKASRPVAAEAWVEAIASSHTSWTPRGYMGGTSGNALIDKAVRAIGGYAAIAQCDSDKLHFLERRFTDIFDSMQDADDVREALPQLAAPISVKQLIDKARQRKLTDEPV